MAICDCCKGSGWMGDKECKICGGTGAGKEAVTRYKGEEVTCANCNYGKTALDHPYCTGCYSNNKWEPKAKADAVNHPAHYTKGKIEVIEILESIVSSMDLTPTEAGLTWSVVKYMARWKNKGGAEDLKKAEWYLKRLIGEVGK